MAHSQLHDNTVIEPSHHLNTNGFDHLSSLPDPILVDIISLLPIHSAIATGVFSHRWRSLWTQITNLILHSNDFSDDKNSDFFTIVENILKQLTCTQINQFKLYVRDPSGLKPMFSYHYLASFWMTLGSLIQSWISKICDMKVEQLQVKAECYLTDAKLQIPSCVFQCQSLVVLELSHGFDLILPADHKISLPYLKKLSLNLNDNHRDLMHTLFKSCPSLEDLFLIATLGEDHHFIDISSLNLKRLNIQAWLMDHTQELKVAIDAPNLEYFNLYDLAGVKFWFVEEPGTKSALEVDLSGNVRPYVMSMGLELFTAISNVRSLSIDLALINGLNGLDDVKFPVLRNLIKLTLPVSFPNYWKAVLVLLQCSPNLEFLGIRMVSKFGAETSHRSLDSSSGSLLTHIKKIEIDISESVGENEMEVIKYLVYNAIVLERVVVSVTEASDLKELQLCQELKFYEELCRAPRSSSFCCIDFRGIEFQHEHKGASS